LASFIDVWANDPAVVVPIANLLVQRTDYYYFVSSIAAYADYSKIGMDETAPTRTGRPGYGGNKARSEKALTELLGNRVGICRPCATIGPRNDGLAHHFWLSRLARDQEIVAPGTGDDAFVEYVDVRDVANWIVDCVEKRRPGIYNVCSLSTPFRVFLNESSRGIGGKAKLVWVNGDFLRNEQHVGTFNNMPFWNPDRPGVDAISSAKARAAGFSDRPLSESSRDSWAWYQTLTADWWHIDMRDIVAALGAQTIILENPPTSNGASTVVAPNGATVVRSAGSNPAEPGPVSLVIDPSQNLSGAVFEGLDYEAIYILDSTIFGHGDWGRLTTTVNGTWLSRAEFQVSPGVKRVGIAGEFLPPGFALTSSLPWHRANFSIFYDGPADTWMQDLDVGAIVHWTGQYEDDNASLTGATKLNEPRSGGFPDFGEIRARKVSAWTTLDLILNYTFNLPPPAPAEVPGYAKDGVRT
jgi:hypothetical protein